jgi:hypothetical protein
MALLPLYPSFFGAAAGQFEPDQPWAAAQVGFLTLCQIDGPRSIRSRQEDVPESKASPSGGIASDRSSTTIATYRDYFKQYIIPQWRDVAIDNVKAVTVEKWLRSLPYADATKAKIRNHLSALFSHLIRWELYSRLSPIASVRQGSGRRRDPDVFTLQKMSAILNHIRPLAVRVMVARLKAYTLDRGRSLAAVDQGFSLSCSLNFSKIATDKPCHLTRPVLFPRLSALTT